MAPADHPSPDLPADALARMHHELKTPVTIIAGRAQLVARAIRRSPSLSNDERAGMLASLAAIDAAVVALVAAIEAIGQEDTDH